MFLKDKQFTDEGRGPRFLHIFYTNEEDKVTIKARRRLSSADNRVFYNNYAKSYYESFYAGRRSGPGGRRISDSLSSCGTGGYICGCDGGGCGGGGGGGVVSGCVCDRWSLMLCVCVFPARVVFFHLLHFLLLLLML